MKEELKNEKVIKSKIQHILKKLRQEEQLDEAERILKEAQPSPAVAHELRLVLETKARAAVQQQDWEAAERYLLEYRAYAAKWRDYCLQTVNQAPDDLRS